ncbi:MAG: LysR family transcriptional regulator, partial [Mangrovicoccus sp.]
MPRSLDMSSLRSFLTIAETGGVTRAANTLNLTQSAVSMQMKRLEEALDVSLFDRSGRQMALTGAGEQLLSYARRIIELNDEAVMRLTTKEFEGELTFGVPHDIVYPHIPAILHRLNQEFPRVKVHLISSYTTDLKARLAERSIDLILTTEPDKTAQSECLVTLPLVWVGAQNGTAWRHRPLRLAFEQTCIFRK